MIYVLLPVYNEEQALLPLLASIEDTLAGFDDYRIVIVNDGSTDASLEVVRLYEERLPITVLDHGVNKGLGVAMHTGFDYLLGETVQGDIIVSLDADNSHDPALIRGLVKEIRSGNAVAIASRFVEGGRQVGLPLHRRILSSGFGAFISLMGVKYTVLDWTCGYRAYDAGVIASLYRVYGDEYITSTGFVVMFEVLFKILKMGESRVVEIPLVLRYDKKVGRSKIRIVETIFQYLKFLLRQKFSTKQTDS